MGLSQVIKMVRECLSRWRNNAFSRDHIDGVHRIMMQKQ